MRRLSRPPSGPLPPVDVLAAGRVDARRLLRPPPLAAAHHYCLLTPPRAAATAARGTAAPHAVSRRGPSAQRPSLGSVVATSWLSPSPWSAGAVATARGGWHGASRNYDRHGTTPTAGVRRPRVYTRCSPVAPPRRHADGYQG